MKNNILKTFTNNLGFKILALLFAFTLWLVVYNIDDPIKSKAMTINVNIENRDSIEDMGKYYEVMEGSNKVTFSITAARSILDKLDETDFIATANMEQISIEEESGIGTVPIEITCTANANSNSYKLSSTNKNLKVLLEDLMIKQFVVTSRTTGVTKEGYALGNVEVTAPNVLKVSGPKSIVQTINSVVATIDVTDIADSWATYEVPAVLYDKNGKEVDTTRLTLSHNTVNVSAEILNTKEVTVSVKPTGTPADGYMITSISTDPEKISLKGDKNILNTINAIEIPSSLISVEGKKENVKATIDVSAYIPEGIEMADTESASVEVTVTIGKIKEKVFSIDSKNIIVTGLSTQAKLEFELSSVAVQISGLEEDIAKLKSEDIKASINVTYLPIGIHQVELTLDLDESKYTYDMVDSLVLIKEVTADDAASSTVAPGEP